MPPSHRRCNTCRHFQAAPLWRKGWCRNPLLYAAHQNHLVDERELDCDRQFGDYWEPLEAGAEAPVEDETLATPVARPLPAPPARIAQSAPPAGLSDVAQPARTRRSEARPRATTRREPATVAPPRTQQDYLRLAVPAAAFLILLVGYTIWSGLLFRGAAAQTPALVAPTATAPVVALATTATPVPSLASAAATPTRVPPTPTLAPPTATIASSAATATAPAAPTPANPTLRPGGTAVVETDTGQGLRLRREPGTSGETIRSIPQGERVSVLEGPRQADGQAWWRVSFNNQPGWVVGEYLKPVE